MPGRCMRGLTLRQASIYICIFMFVVFWARIMYGTNGTLTYNYRSDKLKGEVVQHRGQYARVDIAPGDREVDVSYDGTITHIDMQRSMSVLLENIVKRLESLEKRQNTDTRHPYLNKENDDQISRTGNSTVMLRSDRTQCILIEKELKLYPQCLWKTSWMQTMWQSDPCYRTYGVDGTLCSILTYLGEVEGWCPKPTLQDSTKVQEEMFRLRKAVVRRDLSSLMTLLEDPNERHGFAWIRMRIGRMWPKWTSAINHIAMKQDLTQRKQQKIMVHLGLLTNRSGWGFAENQFKGGPLGELVQWSDLITALYMLGHELTITSEVEQLTAIIAKLPTATSLCQSRKDLPVHMIFTDILGLLQFKDHVKAGYGKFSCLLRVVDSFGTEPAFNLRSFAEKNNKTTFWGGQDMKPQQFFTMFPHSPDNSFMGFVVEQYSAKANDTTTEKNNIAVVYGKNAYMWQGRKQYLDELHNAGLEIHGTVYMQKNEKSPHIPDYVINHGLMTGQELHGLLKKSKIFVGLGFPFEGPAPLEAIANGAVYLNPKFNTPKGSKTDPFFEGKPTERQLTSQHPYSEQFIGEPFVYTLDIDNTQEIRTIVSTILTSNQFEGYMPYEYTEEGFIQRMNAYIEHQNFCEFQKRLSKWPPESAVQILFGAKGKSCKEVCWEKNLICEPSHFHETNTHSALYKNGAICATNKTLVDIFYPAFDLITNDCITQTEELLFSCVGNKANLRRLCPCRTYIKGQSALCVGCEV